MLCKKDILTVKRMYTEAFGSSPEFDEMLFENLSDNLEVLVKSGEIVSSFFKIQCTVGGEKYYYIYAAVTDKPFRNNGYMKELIKRVKNNSDAPLFLVPATEELVSFYEKCGFFPAKAVSENGEIIIEVSEIQKKLSSFCDKTKDGFTVMFSEKPSLLKYEFAFAMQ